jgi:hypothetical protein
MDATGTFSLEKARVNGSIHWPSCPLLAWPSESQQRVHG